MQTFGYIGRAVFTMGLMCSTALAAPINRPTPHSGQVVTVKQDENITFVNEDQIRSLQARQDIKAGDILKTNSKGAMSIVFADQTQIRLARNSTLLVKEVSAGSPSEIEIARGAVWGRSPRGQSRLTVRTPAATAAIRGTEWSLSVTGDQTALQVADGRVELSNPQGTLDVSSGEAASAVTGQAPVRVVVVSRGKREQMLYYLTPGFVPEELPAGSDIKQAYEAAYAGDFKQATALTDAILSKSFPAKNAYWLDAKIGFLTGEEAHIKRALDSGLMLHPDYAALHILQAEYQAGYLGRPDLALETVSAVVDSHPNDPAGLLLLSKILLERRQDIEAMEIIEQAISLYPEIAENYVHQAGIHLKQNQPKSARLALEQAFQLTPGLSVARLDAGQINILEGDYEAALTETLAASADNPSYALALLQLAEIYARLGESVLAKQQLDAADRLDPHTPFTPLYRTSLALHNYEGGDAIDGAQEALSRFHARGGIYENLSENRESGSNISRAFRFLDMEAWGRYYGDRTFDTFTATSYFDQVLNETPGPFFIRREDNSFNPQNGDDLDQISSYLQGVTLDPLSIAADERDLQISKQHFTGASLGVDAILADTNELMRETGTLQGRYNLGTNGQDLPVAFSLKGSHVNIEDTRFSPASDDAEKRTALELYTGAKITARDNLVLFGTYRDNKDESRLFFGQQGGLSNSTSRDTQDLFGFAFWTHHLADDQHFTVGGGRGQTTFDIITTAFPAAVNSRSGFRRETNFNYVTAQYVQRLNNLDVKLGAEGIWNDESVQNYSFSQLANGAPNQGVLGGPTTKTEINNVKLYIDGRYKLNAETILQGQLSYLASLNDNTLGRNQTFLDYHLGVAYEPAPGHWIRLAATENTQTVLPFSIAPVNTLGVKANLIPTAPGEGVRSKIARWDGQWTQRLFTSIEYQNQTTGLLLYNAADSGGSIVIDASELNQLSLSADYWLGGNWGVSGTYSFVDSQYEGNFSDTFPLPFVAERTGKASVKWTHPNYFSATLTLNYVGPLEDSFQIPVEHRYTVDLLTQWEPFKKRLKIRGGIINMLHDKKGVSSFFPAPGRTLFLSGTVRF